MTGYSAFSLPNAILDYAFYASYASNGIITARMLLYLCVPKFRKNQVRFTVLWNDKWQNIIYKLHIVSSFFYRTFMIVLSAIFFL